MGIARSTFYDEPTAVHDDTAIVEAIAAICDEFEFYGWRRVRAGLRHRGLIVNHKKIRRLMHEHDLQPRRRRRYVATTDSDHDQPIHPNRAKNLAIDGPDQLWVADITYVAIREGFAYVAVILDAWSRRAIGYAISRSIDVRLTLAALNTAVERRKPPPGCIHHSVRGSQYTAQGYREALLRHGLVGSMGRRGNPYDNPKAESFIKTLKVEAVYPMAYEIFADVAYDLPRFIDKGLQRSSSPLLAGLSQPAAVRGSQSPADGQISRLILVRPKGPAPDWRSLFHAGSHAERRASSGGVVAFSSVQQDRSKGRRRANRPLQQVRSNICDQIRRAMLRSRDYASNALP